MLPQSPQVSRFANTRTEQLARPFQLLPRAQTDRTASCSGSRLSIDVFDRGIERLLVLWRWQ